MVEAQSLHHIASDAYWWEAYDEKIRCNLGSTAWPISGGLVLIDPIRLAQPALDRLIEIHGAPVAILLTSGNHARAAEVLQQTFQCSIWASESAAGELGRMVDHAFLPGHTVLESIQTINLSAAGPGEVAFLHEGKCCLGDAIINLEQYPFSFLPAKYCVDSLRLPNELKELLSYDLRFLTFAHGSPVVDGVRERLIELLA